MHRSKRPDLTRRRTLTTIGAGLLTLGLPARSREVGLPEGMSRGDSRTIDHALGRTRLSGTPSRVITLFQGATDAVVALGARPVGVVESWTQKPVFRYLRTALKDVELIGLETQPSLEDIIYLEPDLIIASRFRNERIYGLLARMAPTVALDDVFSFRAATLLIGEALNRAVHASELLRRWDQRVVTLRARLAAKFGSRWPLTVAVLDFREDHVRAYLPNSFSGSVLEQLGFIRTPYQVDRSQPLQKITSRESIPFLDAELMFVLMRSDQPAVRQNYLSWSRHPLWTRLDAPTKGRVYEVDNVAWSLSGGILGANLMLDDIERQLGLAS